MVPLATACRDPRFFTRNPLRRRPASYNRRESASFAANLVTCPRREKLFKAHDAKIHAMRAQLPDEEIELSDDDDGGHETETVVEKDTDSEN